MLYMQNFLGFHEECFGCLDQRKLSLVCLFMHDQHAEFSGLPCRIFWGVTAWYQSLGIRIPRAQWGMGLGLVVNV